MHAARVLPNFGRCELKFPAQPTRCEPNYDLALTDTLTHFLSMTFLFALKRLVSVYNPKTCMELQLD